MGFENGENSSSSSSSNGGFDGTARELPGRAREEPGLDEGRVSRWIGVPLRGVAIARLEEVRVRALGGAFVDQTLLAGFSLEGVPGLEPIDSGRVGLNSFALRNRGLLNGEVDGLAAARFNTVECGCGGELAGDTEVGTVI